jgi:hypothetical protein
MFYSAELPKYDSPVFDLSMLTETPRKNNCYPIRSQEQTVSAVTRISEKLEGLICKAIADPSCSRSDEKFLRKACNQPKSRDN